MCGIIGEISLKSQLNKNWLTAGLELINHRGPDFSSTWSDTTSYVHLGHSRLSILDLSTDANQPFQVPDLPYVCVYNGEIYNYIEIRENLKALGYLFSTTSDTEVLLKAFAHYGPTILNSLNGMFSFCIYNYKTKKLYLARDRAGQKPLFYTHQTHSLQFASEIKCLLCHPDISKSTNTNAISQYFIDGYINSPSTLYNDVLSLPPGHLVTYDLSTNDLKIASYFEFPNQYSSDSFDLLELTNLLTSSIDRHLCSDVPIGILLSGGIDSSVLAALAIKHNPDIKCYTVSFPGSSDFDESNSALQVAQHLNLNLSIINADQPSIEDFHNIASQFDQPLSDSSVIPSYLLFREVSNYCKVALGGDGGDELFGGYKRYSTLLKLYPYIKSSPDLLLSILKFSFLRYVSPGLKGRSIFSKLSSLKSLYFSTNYQNFLDEADLSQYLIPLELPTVNNNLTSASNISTFMDRLMLHDFKTYLPNDILFKTDTTSMCHSLELRAPFLDNNVIDYAFSMQSSLKLTNHSSKIPLRTLASQILPTSICKRPKQGFLPPLNHWLRIPSFYDHFRAVIYSCPFYKHSSLDKIFHTSSIGLDNSSIMFQFYMFACVHLKHQFYL